MMSKQSVGHLQYLPYTPGQELVFCSLVLPPGSLLFCRIVPIKKGHIDRLGEHARLIRK